MARYKSQDCNSLLLAVVLSEQIIPGSFAFALDYLVDHELDLSAQIKPLFGQVRMTCNARGLIGRDMLAIDCVKLPSNASKERSGTASCTTSRNWQRRRWVRERAGRVVLKP